MWVHAGYSVSIHAQMILRHFVSSVVDPAINEMCQLKTKQNKPKNIIMLDMVRLVFSFIMLSKVTVI